MNKHEKCKWTAGDIRRARKTEIVPLLVDHRHRLYPLNNGNFRILPDPDNLSRPSGIIIKQNFWIWPEQNLSGNTIDFFMKIQGKSFNQAMLIILGHHF